MEIKVEVLEGRLLKHGPFEIVTLSVFFSQRVKLANFLKRMMWSLLYHDSNYYYYCSNIEIEFGKSMVQSLLGSPDIQEILIWSLHFFQLKSQERLNKTIWNSIAFCCFLTNFYKILSWIFFFGPFKVCPSFGQSRLFIHIFRHIMKFFSIVNQISFWK
jgi:hypothetical protein